MRKNQFLAILLGLTITALSLIPFATTKANYFDPYYSYNTYSYPYNYNNPYGSSYIYHISADDYWSRYSNQYYSYPYYNSCSYYNCNYNYSYYQYYDNSYHNHPNYNYYGFHY